MSYNAKVIEVMIASPSDVREERQIILETILDWNSAHSRDRKTVLTPIAWEKDSAPEMGNRPQAIVNSQITKYADLLVAVFWTRLGSPTGKAESGTVEEIEEHVSAGRPAMVYFSSKSIAPEAIDRDQFSALQRFKRWCKERGLVHEYSDLPSFRMDLSRQLAQTVNRKFSEAPTPGEEQIDVMAGPGLSPDARELLAAAIGEHDGAIMALSSMGGTFIKTKSRIFTEPTNARSVAKWRSALRELNQHLFIEDRKGKGELFFVTNLGYKAGELLEDN